MISSVGAAKAEEPEVVAIALEVRGTIVDAWRITIATMSLKLRAAAVGCALTNSSTALVPA